MTTRAEERKLRSDLREAQRQEERYERLANEQLVLQERARRARDESVRKSEESQAKLELATQERDQTENYIMDLGTRSSKLRTDLETETDTKKINDVNDQIRQLKTLEDDARSRLRHLDDKVKPAAEAEVERWSKEMARQNRAFSEAVQKRQEYEDKAESYENQVEELQVKAAKLGIPLADATDSGSTEGVAVAAAATSTTAIDALADETHRTQTRPTSTGSRTLTPL